MVEKTRLISKRYNISSIEKALEVLEYISEKETLNLMELSDLMKQPKSSLFRIISTLENRGYIARSEENDKYCLGLKTLKLTRKFLENNSIQKVSKQGMEELSLKYGDSVNVGVLTGDEVLYIAIKEGTYPLRFSDVVGTRAPFHASGIGKAISAFLPSEEANHLFQLNELEKITPRTITKIDLLKRELEQVRNRGFALDDEEVVLGARCIAAPIFNMYGSVVAAISLSGITQRFADEKIEDIAKDVIDVAKSISAKLGYSN